MGSAVSLRRSWEERALASGLLSRWWRGRETSREVLLSSPDTLRRHVPAALAPRLRPRNTRPLPPPPFSLWMSGDGGTWEENYRYHRLAGSLVSSAEPMEEFRPLIPREAPRGQAQGPPLPLRDLAYGQMLGEGHFMLHLPP